MPSLPRLLAENDTVHGPISSRYRDKLRPHRSYDLMIQKTLLSRHTSSSLPNRAKWAGFDFWDDVCHNI